MSIFYSLLFYRPCLGTGAAQEGHLTDVEYHTVIVSTHSLRHALQQREKKKSVANRARKESKWFCSFAALPPLIIMQEEEGDLLILGVKTAALSDPAWLLLAATELVKENKRSPIHALLGQETKEYLFWITEDYYCNKVQDIISPEDTRDSERSNNETRQPFCHLIKNCLGYLLSSGGGNNSR